MRLEALPREHGAAGARSQHRARDFHRAPAGNPSWEMRLLTTVVGRGRPRTWRLSGERPISTCSTREALGDALGKLKALAREVRRLAHRGGPSVTTARQAMYSRGPGCFSSGKPRMRAPTSALTFLSDQRLESDPGSAGVAATLDGGRRLSSTVAGRKGGREGDCPRRLEAQRVRPSWMPFDRRGSRAQYLARGTKRRCRRRARGFAPNRGGSWRPRGPRITRAVCVARGRKGHHDGAHCSGKRT